MEIEEEGYVIRSPAPRRTWRTDFAHLAFQNKLADQARESVVQPSGDNGIGEK